MVRVHNLATFPRGLHPALRACAVPGALLLDLASLMTDVSIVVVTGASGFIGAHIVKACLQRGYNVNACV